MRSQIGPYVSAGASMGCGTALHAAVLAPARVRALILALPPTGWETRAAQAAMWELIATMIEEQGVEALVTSRAELDPPDPYREDPQRREQQAAAVRAWDPDRLALVMRGAAEADLPDRDALRQIGVPALILAWTGDPVHPLSTAEELAALLPDAELHVASTAGGARPMDRPAPTCFSAVSSEPTRRGQSPTRSTRRVSVTEAATPISSDSCACECPMPWALVQPVPVKHSHSASG